MQEINKTISIIIIIKKKWLNNSILNFCFLIRLYIYRIQKKEKDLILLLGSIALPFQTCKWNLISVISPGA